MRALSILLPVLALLVSGAAPPQPTPDQVVTAVGRRGMVVSADARATRAGLTVLTAGGSAADAAIATALALGVTEPYSSGLGGGCFVMHFDATDGRITAYSGRETAPAAAGAELYLDQQSRRGRPELTAAGPLAVAVPGELQALELLHRGHGKLHWSTLCRPAEQLAYRGVPVGERLAGVLTAKDSLLKLHSPGGPWWRADGRTLQAGDTLRQPRLAWSLRQLGQLGPASWLELLLAPALDRLMRERGGVLSGDDVLRFRASGEKVLSGRYGGHTMYSIASPSSGGALILQMLNVLDGLGVDTLALRGPRRVELLSRTMEYAFADRARWFGDGRFVDLPYGRLLSAEYADSLRALVLGGRRVDQVWGGLDSLIAGEGDHTTHLCVVDSAGNAVSLTATINTYFGSCITMPDLGVVLNNEMDDFVLSPGVANAFGLVGSPRNRVRPGARPLSSMSPLIVTREGRLELVLGSQGGPKIISTVLNLCLDLLDGDWSVAEALAAPRFHQQWRPPGLRVEPGLPLATLDHLQRSGFVLDHRDPWSVAQLILVLDDGRLVGGADPRAEGTAEGR